MRKQKQRPKSCLDRQQAMNLSESIIKQSKEERKQNKQQPAIVRTFPHSTPPKDYRIDQQDVYNYVRNSVYETFKQKTSRSYDLVKQLIDGVVPEKKKVIDRLCQKYSILRKNKRNSFENAEVNIQQITSRYVKNRSKQKQKQQQKMKLKKDVAHNYRYGSNNQYRKSQQFFHFNGSQLKDLQGRYNKKQKNKETRKSLFESNQPKLKSHPYIQLYEQAQKQVLNNIANNKSINLISQFPNFVETQEWEKGLNNLENRAKQLKIEKKRAIHSARPRASCKLNKPDFYLS